MDYIDMACKTCGAATTITESHGGTTEGLFQEDYECANGHKGWIYGDASNPPKEWKRTGQVFQ